MDVFFLRDKKVFRCAYPALIDILNEAFGLEFKCSEKDYMDLDSEFSWEKWETFCDNVPFCDYCTLKEKVFEWNNRNAKELSYYIV